MLGFFGQDVVAGLPLVINVYIPFSTHISDISIPTVLHTVPPSPLEEILKDYDMPRTVKALKTERRYYIKRGHVQSTPQAPLESGEKSPLTIGASPRTHTHTHTSSTHPVVA